ncbi:Rne/Rng family ribonuclease [Psychrobacter sp. DAB_AL32B]|uniref:Rne/Rng family ribonuclease n=1 Tax=Psychrobacter sp. DAB_AL32B TaxID=1028414 RepID=UPI000B7D1250|nr:Rne/Rng family ribonuclease [Psychrobacter sp. DAB_AL32B]OXL24049.1 ribonuclease [Psychrobacter sp. DAB_AL32B]
MKRILINATQNEEIRVALCKGNHLYDFDLENRTREQKKSNIYKGHVTRVEPSLEAVFVEYGSQRQGFLPIREISAEYLSGNPRDENIKKLIKEGDELIVQVEKEERGNKGAALSTYVSLAGRYLVLMPNNPRGGGISRQISGKLREDMKRMLGSLDLPKGMSVIIRTAGIGKTQEDLQHDLNHLLNIWQAIQEQNQKYPSPRLVHQEAGVVTRAVRDYLRDDIAEIWIDNENAYIEAAGFIDAVMPTQAEKLRKYTDYEPMFSRFNIEKQIETAYQREVRLPSGGSIVIDQTEALVSIDINSAKSTKGSDVAETAYHTNLEAADEIARQLRLRDMGGLIVIDFIDMNDNKHQKEVEKRLIDATKYDRARVQFGDISKFGLMEMSRQRLRPSLEESTGYICPRCHGNGMIRDLRSLSLSIMRQIEQIALKERQGEVQAEVPTDIAAFLLNEKRDALVYLEQDSGTRITILPHAHLESPNFKLHFNRDGFAPSSYERITDTQQQEYSELGYNVDWQTAEKERPEQQPTRQPRPVADNSTSSQAPARTNAQPSTPEQQQNSTSHSNEHRNNTNTNTNTNNVSSARAPQPQNTPNVATTSAPVAAPSANVAAAQPQAVAWLSNLFAQAPQAQTTNNISSRDAADAIEALVNTGAQSLGSFGQVDNSALNDANQSASAPQQDNNHQNSNEQNNSQPSNNNGQRQQTRHTDNATDDSNTGDSSDAEDRRRRKPRKSRPSKPRQRKEQADETDNNAASNTTDSNPTSVDDKADNQDKRQQDNRRPSDRNRNNRQDNRQNASERNVSESNASENDSNNSNETKAAEEQTRAKRKSNSQRSSRGKLDRGETLTTANSQQSNQQSNKDVNGSKNQSNARRNQDPNEVVLQVNAAATELKAAEVVHLSLDDSKSVPATRQVTAKHHSVNDSNVADIAKERQENTAQQHADKQTAVEQSIIESSEGINNDSADSAQNSSTQAHAAENSDALVDQAKVDEVQISATDNKAQKSVSTDDSKGDDEKPLVAETATSKVSADSQTDSTSHEQKSVEAKPEDIAPVAEAQKVEADDNRIDTDQVDTNQVAIDASSTSHSALELTHDALFAKRYITAAKFGQASNDPRVVRRQQTQSQATQTSQKDEQAIVSVPTIRGTVGEFIRATLPEAESRLAADGVINCFNAAIALHLEQAHVQVVVNDKVANTNDNQRATGETANNNFDFSNYGYQPLAADYLARFEAMTQAVSQFAATQGKTDVEPRAIDKRASNDPRGQHPDYQEPVVLAVSDEPINESVQANSKIDAHKVEATALANPAQASEVSTDSEQLLQVEQTLEKVTTEQTEVEVTPEAKITKDEAADVNDVEIEETGINVEAAEVKDANLEQSETEQPTESIVEPSTKEEIQAAKSKTTIASYKNMIENVAEQLLPQKGMFNLTTPKVPKARTRKPKAEHKKPTQAEKSESDNSDSDS